MAEALVDTSCLTEYLIPDYCLVPPEVHKMLSVVALVVVTGCLFIYSIFISSTFSVYRHLPKPKQAPLLLRLFHEPTTFELEQWMGSVPNHGLIRYFGFLNQERLMVTTQEGLKELLLREAYTFDKSSRLSAIQAPAGVSGLVSAKGLLHKVSNDSSSFDLSSPRLELLILRDGVPDPPPSHHCSIPSLLG